MAVVKAPFLSLAGSGQFAKTLVAAVWKGIPYMRQYVVPTNPNTSAQVAQRTVFASAVHAWQNYLQLALIKTAWNLWASLGSKPMTGFNAAMESLLQVLSGDPDASYGTAAVLTTGGATPSSLEVTMKNMDDGAAGDEAGDYIVRAGLAKDDLTDYVTNATIAAGVLEPDLMVAAAGTEVWVQVLKLDGAVRRARTGVLALTVQP